MFQWNPEDYARNSSGQEKWARELLGQLHLRDDDQVLDVGCGDGRITAAIAAAVGRGRVVGTDLSRDFVEFARQAFPPVAHPNLSFMQCDMRQLAFGSEFSAVFSNAAMHWVKDHRPVLRGIAQALMPGGRCLLQMGGGDNGADVIGAFRSVAKQPRWVQAFEGFESSYGFHTPADYRLWLGEAGLQPIEVKLIEKDMVHSDPQAFMGWLRTAWHPYTAPVAESERDEFIQQVSERYLAMHRPDAAGRVHVRMERLQVAAVKPPA